MGSAVWPSQLSTRGLISPAARGLCLAPAETYSLNVISSKLSKTKLKKKNPSENGRYAGLIDAVNLTTKVFNITFTQN